MTVAVLQLLQPLGLQFFIDPAQNLGEIGLFARTVQGKQAALVHLRVKVKNGVRPIGGFTLGEKQQDAVYRMGKTGVLKGQIH